MTLLSKLIRAATHPEVSRLVTLSHCLFAIIPIDEPFYEIIVAVIIGPGILTPLRPWFPRLSISRRLCLASSALSVAACDEGVQHGDSPQHPTEPLPDDRPYMPEKLDDSHETTRSEGPNDEPTDADR